ncbi:hypothetical protein WS80_29110 [Burkholderia pseudomultivorans]|nr:hypothetical protein WS80_29110 [Burkholderia pseudomultivorans]
MQIQDCGSAADNQFVVFNPVACTIAFICTLILGERQNLLRLTQQRLSSGPLRRVSFFNEMVCTSHA